MESVKATGALQDNKNYPSRFRLASNSSNFGLKGIEEISSNLKAVFQIEVGVNLSNGAFTNTNSGSVIGLRNSMLGLSGSFGTLSYGIWDTPFKVLTSAIDPYWGTGVGYMASLANSVGMGAVSSTMATEGTLPSSGTNYGEVLSFDRRQGNTVQYWTPTIYNVTARVMYGANADRTSADGISSSPGKKDGNPDLISASLTYDNGSLFGGASFEQHDDYFNNLTAPVTGVTGTSTKDTGYKVAARYKFDIGLALGAYWDMLRYQQTTTAGDSFYQRSSVTAFATQSVRDFTLKVGYARAADGNCSKADGAVCNTNGLGATHGVVGGSYNLSKRTDVYAVFSRIWNSNNNYNFLLSGVGTSPLAAGADPQAIGLGIRHTF
jgi:predicted porin